MSKVYCIGKFQFDSYDKYQEALDDIEKIRYISRKMDINEPGVAQRLYTLIREGKIIFKSDAVSVSVCKDSSAFASSFCNTFISLADSQSDAAEISCSFFNRSSSLDGFLWRERILIIR